MIQCKHHSMAPSYQITYFIYIPKCDSHHNMYIIIYYCDLILSNVCHCIECVNCYKDIVIGATCGSLISRSNRLVL